MVILVDLRKVQKLGASAAQNGHTTSKVSKMRLGCGAKQSRGVKTIQIGGSVS